MLEQRTEKVCKKNQFTKMGSSRGRRDGEMVQWAKTLFAKVNDLNLVHRTLMEGEK